MGGGGLLMALNRVKARRSGFAALEGQERRDSLTKRAQTREVRACRKTLFELLHEWPGADLSFGDERSSFT